MEQDEHELEEGEIEDEDDVVNVYTPLERPKLYALDAPQKRFPEVSTHYSESEDELQSSDSDSDSDTGIKQTKKPKRIKIIPKPLKQKEDKLKKYDIWSTRAQQDVLASSMNSCDVTLKDRSRNVESYDFSLAGNYYDELENQQGQKRTRHDMKTVNFKPRKRNSNGNEDKRIPRELPELNVNVDSNVEDIVKDIACKLNEKRDDLILKVVEVMGKKRSIEIFEEARQIESEGGMLIMNQTRRRTPGGVFLYLVRNDYHITLEQKQNIFSEDKQKYNRMVKEKKKKKLQKLKMDTQLERNRMLPELLTRAEAFTKDTTKREMEETDETNCTNPPPSPESDHHESCDSMEPSSTMASLPVQSVKTNSSNNELNHSNEEMKIYDDDFLDINCGNEMDFF